MTRVAVNRNKTRANRLAAGLVPAAALMTIVALPVADAATVVAIGPLAGTIEDELQGSVCQVSNGCVIVPHRVEVDEAVAAIDDAVRAALDAAALTADPSDDEVLLFAYSHGSRMAAHWLDRRAGTPGAPTPEELSFMLIGNPTRVHGGSDRNDDPPFTVPETDYQVVDVVRQYDMAGDYPDRMNFLAFVNMIAAFGSVHNNYEVVDLNDPTNIVWTEGNTTYVFVQTPELPMLDFLRNIGLGFVADTLNEPLREIVEQAYDRDYLPEPLIGQGQASKQASKVAASTVAVSDPTIDSGAAALSVDFAEAEEADSGSGGSGSDAADPADVAEALEDDELAGAPDDDDADDLADLDAAETAELSDDELDLDALEEEIADEADEAAADEAAADEAAADASDSAESGAAESDSAAATDSDSEAADANDSDQAADAD